MAKTRLHELVSMSPRLLPTTKSSYLRSLDDWIKYAGENPANWTPVVAQDYYLALLERVSTGTANRMLYALRYAAKRYHELDGQVDFARAIEAKPARDLPKAEKALSRDEVAALVEAVQGDRPVDQRDRALLAIALSTGMRRTSLAAIPVRPFEADDKDKHIFTTVPIKGGRQWKVPFAPTVVRVAGPYEAWLRQHRVDSGVFFRRIHKSVHGYRPGLGFSADGWAIWAIVTAMGDKTGINLHPHIFRHTLVSWLREQGVASHLITTITGHRDASQGPAVLGEYTDYRLLRKQASDAVEHLIRPFF